MRYDTMAKARARREQLGITAARSIAARAPRKAPAAAPLPITYNTRAAKQKAQRQARKAMRRAAR